ncbi:PilC/PilY family type IV pilus protein [Granulosicoccus sp.]|nr:PilC/PilY family type IV pilus protein [Granulosicoccus sp.]MDB4224052.1 PilC/PilY family type IV pilus protein [Granulosicoccus sp.]
MHQKTLVPYIRKLLIIVGGLLGTTLTSLSAYADDTEVFFSSARGGTLSKSNILFVLDNSGSMGYDSDNVWRWGTDYNTPDPDPANPPDGLLPNRMSDLQAVMDNILSSIQNVNIGIMEFTHECVPSPESCDSRKNYAEIIHYVEDIDMPGNRESLINSVEAMRPRTNTPITAALYEAALHMTTTEDTTGRDPKYRPVILSECQQNHIVILSDGIANSDVPTAGIETLMNTSTGPDFVSGSCPADGPATGDYCGVELAAWLNNNDHLPISSSPASPKINPISVHTVGFAVNSEYLEDLADAGGGAYYFAEDSTELADVFDQILTEVKDVDTTFVTPVTSTDRLNRLGQSDDLYFAMFNPSLKPQWDGNLKKYTLGLDSAGNVVIKDVNGDDAIDPATGYFADGAKSVWSNLTDGAFVTKGGAAAEISHDTRNVYTSIGASLSPHTTGAGPIDLATNIQTKVHVDNTTRLTAAVLGVTGPERASLIEWARGSNIDDPTEGGSRQHIGDILHSTPISVGYEESQGGPLIFFGTNEGFLHAINSQNGTEEYSFIPQELLGNLKIFRENSRDELHPYGLDGAITYLHIDDRDTDFSDKDGDGIVNNGEAAAIFFGMRRGGRDYYSLDVSSRTNPKLNWHIKGGTGEFASLGQSWSKPTPAVIRYKGNVRHVLIFGGGYDENQDPTKEANLDQIQSTDTVGNAIFIVDAETGNHIWSADGSTHSDMDYSIPSDIRVLDVDSDGLADRMYVGDMGGQVWRFDINSGHDVDENSSTLVYGGVLAKLGGQDNGDPTISGARRFYSKPDVALISKEGQHFMSVSIGSGWRAHPRHRNIEDRFYMIRDNRPLEKIMNNSDFGAKNTQTNPSLPATWGPVKEDDLRNITDGLDTLPIPSQTGWMLEFDDSVGEKSLSGSLTINNQLVFATYTAEVHTDECLPAADSTTVYAIDVLRGNPVLPLASGSPLTKSDRSTGKATNGIPPEPVPVIKQHTDGSYSTGVILGTSTILENLSFSDLTKRTYWHDRRRGSQEPTEVTEETCSSGDGLSHDGGGIDSCTSP